MQLDQMTKALEETFGLTSFRKGQVPILQSVLSKKDTLAVLPTGGGKSLCYQIPAVLEKGLVIVISPLIALMKDQVENLRSKNIPAGHLHSGQPYEEKRQIFNDIKNNSTYVLYLSPERVQNNGFKEWILSQNVKLFAIDEAHCVSQWGPDFREDYHKLSLLRELRPDIPLLALTATATPEVLHDVGLQLKMKSPETHVYGFYRPNLFYQVEVCSDEHYKQAFLKKAIKETPIGRILVYCGTRQQSENLCQLLSSEFSGVSMYHAGLSLDYRKEIQNQMAKGELRIITATNAFGMGIDYPDVRLVVHYQMPANIESFYQEMGRAGRDGKKSRCLLLYSKKDKGLQSFFITQSTATADVISRRWSGLNAIVQFSEGGGCRHSGILTYFRDKERIDECGHCDTCRPHSDQIIGAPTQSSIKSLKKKVKNKTKAKESTNHPSNNEVEVRLILLRDWRRSYSKEKDIPAFMVFSDKTLTDLAQKNPKNIEELARVYGFGPARTESLGTALMEVLGHL